VAHLPVVFAFAEGLTDALEVVGVFHTPQAVLEPHVLCGINNIAK